MNRRLRPAWLAASPLMLLCLAADANAQDAVVFSDTFDAGPATTSGALLVTGPDSFSTTPTVGCETTCEVPSGSEMYFLDADQGTWNERLNCFGAGVTDSEVSTTLPTVAGGNYTVTYELDGVYASAGTPSVNHTVTAYAVDGDGDTLGSSAPESVDNATYEEAVEHSCRLAESEGWYDANPGGDNELVQLRAYGEIAFEIYDQLRDAPALVAVPMSNGTTLAGVHRGFRSLYRRGKTSKLPRMVGGSGWRRTPSWRATSSGSRPVRSSTRPRSKRPRPTSR